MTDLPLFKLLSTTSPSQSLYRGWFPVISSLCCSNFVYFYTFNSLKKLTASGGGKSRPGKDLLMGIASGKSTYSKTNDYNPDGNHQVLKLRLKGGEPTNQNA